MHTSRSSGDPYFPPSRPPRAARSPCQAVPAQSFTWAAGGGGAQLALYGAAPTSCLLGTLASGACASAPAASWVAGGGLVLGGQCVTAAGGTALSMGPCSGSVFQGALRRIRGRERLAGQGKAEDACADADVHLACD